MWVESVGSDTGELFGPGGFGSAKELGEGALKGWSVSSMLYASGERGCGG